jgi:DGQHR domain-containing protein
MSTKNDPPDDDESESEDREDREEREDRKYSYPALKLHQNGHDMFMTTIPDGDVFPYTSVEYFHENPEEGYQRKYDQRRAEEIAEYLSTPGKSIPGLIVLSAQVIADLTYSSKTKQISYQRVPGAFKVLDGQHRIWGYHKCRIRHRVPVAIYHGLDRQTEARLFLDINGKHKGVPKAHLINVKNLAGTETETEAHLRHLFNQLNRDENSPLCGRLVATEATGGKLSRASFDSALGRAVRSESLRKLPTDKQYEVILNYLRAVHSELVDKEQLVKRNYFCASFELFDEVLRKAKQEHNTVRLSALQCIVRSIGEISESDFTGPAKRQRLVEAMRSRIHSDTDIDNDDV